MIIILIIKGQTKKKEHRPIQGAYTTSWIHTHTYVHTGGNIKNAMVTNMYKKRGELTV